MKIIINRDSICMGDDAFSHEVEYEVPTDMTVGDLLVLLNQEKYLPNIVDTKWKLYHGGEKVAVYCTEMKEITNPDLLLRDLIEQNSGDNRFMWSR